MRAIVFGLVGTNRGGIETFLLNMIEHMNSDYIFDYIVEESSCMHLDRINNRSGVVYHVLSRKNHPIKNAFQIYQILRDNKKKYCCAYFNLSSLSWILPELIARILGYRVIVHSHNAELIDKNNSPVYRILNSVNKKWINSCKITRLACSDYAAEFMFGNNKYTIIKNGISINKFKYNLEIRQRIRTKLGIHGKRAIGFVGRLEYQKNPLFAVEIFNELLKINSNYVLLIVGDGSLRRETELLVRTYGIEENVYFMGNIESVNEIYSAMDAILLPSRHEGLGIVLIEAQTNGLLGLTSKDVVPKEAYITDLLHSKSLSDRAIDWAHEIEMIMKCKSNIDRERYSNVVQKSGYDIETEAIKLQHILFK